MNLELGRKQSKLHPGFKNGNPNNIQLMVKEDGEPKGIRMVLKETELWKSGLKLECSKPLCGPCGE
ncbi:hypothetical protein L873DRAFT_1812932 [Choiromyces venosus 120613-1]|uniref:Uncharacterized protein n=1 Tax=Choiromyces venosus 120613-1 TaxID=1336337 RepID=A0A3N4JEL4_9PEZI|nr:hypothetical protein L873DRAFT_1812932 [Choiromyces venosus 120613-1]